MLTIRKESQAFSHILLAVTSQGNSMIQYSWVLYKQQEDIEPSRSSSYSDTDKPLIISLHFRFLLLPYFIPLSLFPARCIIPAALQAKEFKGLEVGFQSCYLSQSYSSKLREEQGVGTGTILLIHYLLGEMAKE